MITGSHNPPDHNGFKICLGKSTLVRLADPGDKRDRACAAEFASGRRRGRVTSSVLDDYCRRHRFTISTWARESLKAVVDAGNGMGGVTAVPVYRNARRRAGRAFHRARFDISRIIIPTRPSRKICRTLIAAVRETSADLGIAFDGDGDRIGVVDENGPDHLGRRVDGPAVAVDPCGTARRDDHRRGEMLAEPFRRHRRTRRQCR